MRQAGKKKEQSFTSLTQGGAALALGYYRIVPSGTSVWLALLAFLARLLLRRGGYVFKTATGNRPLQLLPDGQLLWTYRDNKTGKLTSLKLQPMEWMRRYLQHILPSGFARVRTFGWLHPAAKVRGNRVRALLGQKPLLTDEEQQTWNPPPDPEPVTPEPSTDQPVCCPRCRCPMRLIDVWLPGEEVPLPNRPP